MKGQDKPKKLGKKVPQKSLKEKRKEKKAEEVLRPDQLLGRCSFRSLAGNLRVPPDPPLTTAHRLRVRRAEDVPLIAAASHDPETRRRLDDEPLTPDRELSEHGAHRGTVAHRAAARRL